MTDDPKNKPAHLPEPSPVEHGGRVELRLIETTDGTTRYAARWFTADEKIEGQIAVSAEGPRVSIDAPEDLPEWLSTFTTSLVRTTARQAQKDDAWPRRLTRWRKAPEAK